MYRENDTIGPYTLKRRLGKGAFGVVWLAEETTMFGRFEYALKMAARDDIDLQAVAEEVATWNDARGHNNVLPLITANIYGEDFVIVSEYAPDGSLQTWLNQHGGRAPDLEAAVKMTNGILDGLLHLHSKHIIHRDLKPDNILLRGATPMLADFGLARVLKTTQSSNLAGTVQYMSPEALDNKRIVQVDVWSVGVMLYQMLAGRLPFKGQGPPLMMSILRDEPAPLPASVPAGLRDIVNRALQKDLAQRYPTTQAMRDALRAFMQRQASPTQPVITPARPSQPTPAPPLPTLPLPTPQPGTPRPFVVPAPTQPPPAQTRLLEPPIAPAPTPSRTDWRLPAAIVGAVVLLSVILLGYKLFSNGTVPTPGGGNPTGATTQLENYTQNLPNSIKLEMVAVPAGKFLMGTTDAQIAEAKKYCSGCNFDGEKPQHEVTIAKPFFIGKHEVTQEQWQAVMGNNPSNFQNCPKCPVEQVSWDDAKEFIKKLNILQNKYVYRLPSEAEWEYNARAGTKTAFAFGDSLSSEQANFDGNYPYGGAAKGEYRGKTTEVGSFRENAWGVCDMHGNVWEWVEDIYSKDYNNVRVDGAANVSVGDSSIRVLRGGSWRNGGDDCRSANRYGFSPVNRYDSIGLRVAAASP